MNNMSAISESKERSFGHYPTLDGVSGLAILMVLVFHFYQEMPAMNLPHWPTQVLRLLSIGFHPFIYGWLRGNFYEASWSPLRGHLGLSVLADFLLLISATIVVCWFSWMLFERRLLALKERIPYQPGVPVLRRQETPTATGELDHVGSRRIQVHL
jgi:peptidoglycan/LPS O-acetylase OafA/YrhL